MSRLHTTQQMALRKLTRQVLVQVRESSAEKVLVTSALPGEGKSLFVKAFASGLEKTGLENKPRIIAADELGRVEPRNTNGFVLVDGPAFFDDSGFEKIPERWMEAFDSAVVVLVGRASRRRDVIELFDWLRQYDIRDIWPIWNEKLTPPPKSLAGRVKLALGLDKDKAVKPRDSEKMEQKTSEPARSPRRDGPRPEGEGDDKPKREGFDPKSPQSHRDGPRPEPRAGEPVTAAEVVGAPSPTGYGAATGLSHSPKQGARGPEPAFVTQKIIETPATSSPSGAGKESRRRKKNSSQN